MGKLESSRKEVGEGSYKDKWDLVEEKEGRGKMTGAVSAVSERQERR